MRPQPVPTRPQGRRGGHLHISDRDRQVDTFLRSDRASRSRAQHHTLRAFRRSPLAPIPLTSEEYPRRTLWLGVESECGVRLAAVRRPTQASRWLRRGGACFPRFPGLRADSARIPSRGESRGFAWCPRGRRCSTVRAAPPLTRTARNRGRSSSQRSAAGGCCSSSNSAVWLARGDVTAMVRERECGGIRADSRGPWRGASAVGRARGIRYGSLARDVSGWIVRDDWVLENVRCRPLLRGYGVRHLAVRAIGCDAWCS